MCNNNNETESKSQSEPRSLGENTVVQMPPEKGTTPTLFRNKCCVALCFLCIVIVVSFFTSWVTTKFLLNTPPVKSSNCVSCNDDVNKIPIPEKQTQGRPMRTQRIGAQLSANPSLLKENSELVWMHDGSDDYINGVNHVTQPIMNTQYDCLETTTDGHYLISIQLTYLYTAETPSNLTKCYFTLTRFRNSEAHVVAKSDYVIPPPEQRGGMAKKQPTTMVRSDKLRKGDRLCVTVSHPNLIYASRLDNFLSIVAL